MEHTTLHLLYSRFWCKFLYDEGLLPCAEPFRRRTSHGMILGEDGEKMSKSRGNVVNPDDVVARYGADTFRIFEMYVGAFDQATAWSEEGVNGCHRFLNRVWSLRAKVTRSTGCPAAAAVDDDSLRLMHRTILAVSQRIERMKFNTAVAALMEFSNALQPMQAVPAELFQCLCLLLYPFAPHVAEELWEGLGNTLPISRRQWPVADPELAKPKRLTIAIQVNGKLRDTMDVEEDATEEEITQMAGQRPKVLAHTGGKLPRRTVYVPGRLVNLIV
jgi:leucyl-tRNA synthetase